MIHPRKPDVMSPQTPPRNTLRRKPLRMVLRPYARAVAAASLASVAIVLGLASYAYWQKHQNDRATPANSIRAVAAAVETEKCKTDDRELCNFIHSWNAAPAFTARYTVSYEGFATTYQFEASSNSRFRLTQTGSAPHEVIGIGTMVYIRDAGDNIWWAQEIPQSDVDYFKGSFSYNFAEPQPSVPIEKQINYHRIGIEDCGGVKCYKYRVIDPNDKGGDKQYIWFNTTDFTLRRVVLEHNDASVTDQTISYQAVTITTPAKTKPVNLSDVIIPGQNVPTRVPSGVDLDEYLKQLRLIAGN